ncbi:hypothetical protein ACFQO4_03085 [Saliphagus sp. GCM10025334]
MVDAGLDAREIPKQLYFARHKGKWHLFPSKHWKANSYCGSIKYGQLNTNNNGRELQVENNNELHDFLNEEPELGELCGKCRSSITQYMKKRSFQNNLYD